MTTKLSIHQKLLELRKSILYLQKDTKGHNYNYASGTTLLSQIRPKMDELGLLLFTSVRNQNFQVDEKRYVVSGEMVFTWINADKPEEIVETVLFGAGVDNQDPSKAIGKMMTYFERYNLLKTFQIATDNDDPDRFQDKADKVADKTNIKATKEKQEKNAEDERKLFLAQIVAMRDGLENGAKLIEDLEARAKNTIDKMPIDHLKFVWNELKKEQTKKFVEAKRTKKAVNKDEN
jgi:ERF superfamily protein